MYVYKTWLIQLTEFVSSGFFSATDWLRLSDNVTETIVK